MKLFTHNPRGAADHIFLPQPILYSYYGNSCNFSSRGLPTSVLPTLAGSSLFLSIRISFHCPCPTHRCVFLSLSVVSSRGFMLTQAHMLFVSLLCVLLNPNTRTPSSKCIFPEYFPMPPCALRIPCTCECTVVVGMCCGVLGRCVWCAEHTKPSSSCTCHVSLCFPCVTQCVVYLLLCIFIVCFVYVCFSGWLRGSLPVSLSLLSVWVTVVCLPDVMSFSNRAMCTQHAHS